MPDWIYAVILGVIEGLTEFIPVSSTGMMLLAKQAMGLPDGFWDTFAVMIQLGAILAVVALYFTKLWNQVVNLPSDPAARQFALTLIVAFLPSVGSPRSSGSVARSDRQNARLRVRVAGRALLRHRSLHRSETAPADLTPAHPQITTSELNACDRAAPN